MAAEIADELRATTFFQRETDGEGEMEGERAMMTTMTLESAANWKMKGVVLVAVKWGRSFEQEFL